MRLSVVNSYGRRKVLQWMKRQTTNQGRIFHLPVEETASPVVGVSATEVPACNCPPVLPPNNGGASPPSGAGDSLDTTTGQLSPINEHTGLFTIPKHEAMDVFLFFFWLSHY